MKSNIFHILIILCLIIILVEGRIHEEGKAVISEKHEDGVKNVKTKPIITIPVGDNCEAESCGMWRPPCYCCYNELPWTCFDEQIKCKFQCR
ncbi:hypothetical protein vseg_004011 [Gypsophila vaccaria]